MIGTFLSAIQFLTVFTRAPSKADEKKMSAAMIYFPVVGALVGLLLVGIYVALSAMDFPPFLIGIIVVVLLAMVTGGMHLDGLADTADALCSGKQRNEMLAIMRDPHIGAMGTISIVSVILLKVGLLSMLGTASQALVLVLMCAASRWAAVLAMFLFPYARENGKAKVFIRGINAKIFFISTFITFLCVFALGGIPGIAALLVVAGCAYMCGTFVSKKIDGITGDTLGAIVELSEIVFLFVIFLPKGTR